MKIIAILLFFNNFANSQSYRIIDNFSPSEIIIDKKYTWQISNAKELYFLKDTIIVQGNVKLTGLSFQLNGYALDRSVKMVNLYKINLSTGEKEDFKKSSIGINWFLDIKANIYANQILGKKYLYVCEILFRDYTYDAIEIEIKFE